MPVPACFHLADRVFPRVRAEAGRRLVAQGWSQSRTAQALGVSQAMVSKYTTTDSGEADALVLRLVEELVTELGAGGGNHAAPRLGISPWCATLTTSHSSPDADDALRDLLAAEARLVATNPTQVIPQIGMNLARALPTAQGLDGVLSFPARLVDAGGRLVRPAPPSFGASRHLAACLLALRRRDPHLVALGSIRGGTAVRDAATRIGTVVDLPTDDPDRDQAFAHAAATAGPDDHLFHDPGTIGIEPCLYVAGRDATSVAETILRIDQNVIP